MKDSAGIKNNNIEVGVLRSLAIKIPTPLLQDYFPGIPPEDVRELMIEAADYLAESGWHPGSLLESGIRKTESSSSINKDHPMLTLFTDGASRGNPGEAGAGVQILDNQGRELATLGKYLGQCTNNMAEYHALILGLGEARKLGNRKISIYLDSELIVRQIEGRYKVKDTKLKPLFAKVRELLAGFTTWQVNHVSRSENMRADALANQGIDDHLAGRSKK